MQIARVTYLNVVEHIAGVFLLAFPSALLLIKGGMNGILIFTLLITLIIKFLPPAGILSSPWPKELWWYVVAMFGLSLAIFASQVANNELLARPHDAASRFWLAIPVCWLLMHLRKKIFWALQLGFPIGAILGWWFAEDTGYGFTLPWLNKILFGDYLLLFGMLSVLSIDWLGRDTLWVRIVKSSGFLIGFLGGIQSGTRGALLALPVFLILYVYYLKARISLKVIVTSLAASLVVILLAYSLSDVVKNRLHQLADDVVSYQQGDKDTSTGIRWQLNLAAIEIYLRHPAFGVGPEVVGGVPDGFAREIQKMYAEGRLSKGAAEVGICCQAHNEILAKAADLGTLGLCALLALYLVPFYLFILAMKSPIAVIRQSGLLGAIFVGAHFVFGFTVGLLGLTMTAAFYGFSVAVLLAACYHPELNARKE